MYTFNQKERLNNWLHEMILPIAFSLRRGIEVRGNTSQIDVANMTVQCSFNHLTD
jgi:hypothetical protein